MDELLKAGRLIHFSISVASFSVLTFLYPIVLSSHARRTYIQAVDLQFALGDFRRQLSDAEARARQALEADFNRAAYGAGMELRDNTEWYKFDAYALVDAREWGTNERERLLIDIQKAWLSPERITVFRVADVRPILAAIHSTTGSAEGVYWIQRAERRLAAGKPVIALTLATPIQSASVEVDVPLAVGGWINPHAYLRKHFNHESFLPNGRLAPDVYARRDIKTVSIEHASRQLAEEQEKRTEVVSVLGISVNVVGLAIFAPLILLALLVYIKVHFQHVIDVAPDLTQDEQLLISRFPWTPLYSTRLSNVVDFCTLGFLPVVAAGALTFILPEVLARNIPYRILSAAEAVAVLVLSVMAFRHARHVSVVLAGMRRVVTGEPTNATASVLD